MKKVFKSLFLGLVTVGMFFTGCKLEEESNNLALIAAAASGSGHSGKTITGIALYEDGALDSEATSKDNAQTLTVGKKYEVELVYVYSDGSKDEDPIDLDEFIDDDKFGIEIKGNKDIITVHDDVYLQADAVNTGTTCARAVITLGDYKKTYYFTTAAAQVVTLSEITVKEVAYSLNEGETGSYVVTAKYTDGTTQNVTSSATATSSDPSVATASAGTITAKAEGSATITLSYTEGGVTETATISVSVLDSSDTLKSIAITTSNSSVLAYNSSVTLAATGIYEKAGTVTISPTYTIVSGASYATLTGTVLKNSNTSGSQQSVTVKAEFGGMSVTKVFNFATRVDEADLELSIDSVNLTTAGETKSFNAIYTSNDNSTDVTNTATMTSSDTGVATVNNGVITAVANGTAIITVTYGGCEETITVTVNIASGEGSATIGFDFN